MKKRNTTKKTKRKTTKSALKVNRAFTLIEIIAVIIIIGIVSIIVVPAVISYVSDTKDTTFTSYEKSMKQAAENQILSCLSGNEENCSIPSDNEKSTIYLSSLIDDGYIDLMKDPQNNSFCESNTSYVEVKKTGTGDFEYEACLYCGDYHTNNSICTTYSLDGDDPVCGEVTGASTRWTKERRTISVKCSDATSGCASSSFSKSFNKTTKVGEVTIVDRSGRTKACSVNVYVDKTKPSCEIKANGEYIESVGWYSIVSDVELKNMKDEDSGLLTYGMGKGIANRDYNKLTHMTVGSGITTVVGYVKDTAGNEGLCAQDIRVGTEIPKFNLYYGYKLYPTISNDANTMTLNGITQNGSNFRTTTDTPKMTFNYASKYGAIDKVVITLNSAIGYTTIGKVFNDSTELASGIMTAGQSKIEFLLNGQSANNLVIQLGTINGATYNINRIEVFSTNGEIWTNKDVTINIDPQDAGMKTIEASYDSGSTWVSDFTKSYTANYSNISKTRNAINMQSAGVGFFIKGIDKVKPTATIVAKKKTSGTVTPTDTWSGQELNFIITQGTVGASGAKIYYCRDYNNSCVPNKLTTSGSTITEYNNDDGVYYLRYRIVSNSGMQSEVYSYKAKIDVGPPSCRLSVTDYNLNSVTIKAECTDESGMKEYQFSYNGGAYATQTTNSKTFNSVRISTFKVKVVDLADNISSELTLSTDEKNRVYGGLIDILDEKYNEILSASLLTSYPIGSIYKTTLSDEDTVAKMHNKYGGTWELFGTGRELVGVDTSNDLYKTVGKTGGSNTATLQVANLASHNHSIPELSGSTNSAGSHSHSFSGTTGAGGTHSHTVNQNASFTVANGQGSGASGIPASTAVWGSYYSAHWFLLSTSTAGNHTHSYSGTTGAGGSHSHTVTTTASTTGNTGSGNAFSTKDPYITVYMFKRIG